MTYEESLDSMYERFLRERNKPASEPPVLQAIDYSSWRVSEPPPPQRWTVTDRIPENQVCLFSGHGGTGKSTIALDLAAAHTAPYRNDWLGSTADPGPAFFLDAEDPPDVIHRRLHAQCLTRQCDFPDLISGGLQIFSLVGKDAVLGSFDPKTSKITPTPLYEQLIKQIEQIKPRQIILASAANMFAGNENDRPQVTQFINLCSALAIAAGGSVVLISHPSRAGLADGSGYSGSTQWHNSVRARMTLTGTENGAGTRKLEFPKNSYGLAAEAVPLEWCDGRFKPIAAPTQVQQAARNEEINLLTIDCLRRALGEGQNISPSPTANNSATARLLTEKELKAAHVTKDEIRDCVRRLLDDGRITKERYGSPSDNTWRLTVPQ
jgi:RecA-family ATPase